MIQPPSPPHGSKNSSPLSINRMRRKLRPSLESSGEFERIIGNIMEVDRAPSCKAMDEVVGNNDLVSLIIIAWVDPMCCLPILLTCKRFNSIYMHRIGGPVHSLISLFCTRVSLMEWAVGVGMPTEHICNYCAGAGDLAALQWLRGREPPCVWSEDTCSAAARGGHLSVLMWMRRQQPPCPWDEYTCSGAVTAGSLSMLKWLRSQQPPCHWSEWTSTVAIDEKRVDILSWMLEQSPPCPMDDYSMFCAHQIIKEDATTLY
jgi:hypothetical protein